MDAAKVIGYAVANRKHPRKLVGYFKGLTSPPPLYAVPTTAGTGSEVTVAAVISDPDAGTKLVIADTRLVPAMAALDPALMVGLPPAVTAATGMDALTHAVEAFIGQWSTAYTDRMALAAVAMVYENLKVAYRTPRNLEARERMSLAATYAGIAFTRANVGYVHAIAHQLGGKYHTPHGLANAIMLPHVLRFLAPAITKRLALLAVAAKVGEQGERPAVLAKKFVESIAALNRSLGIPGQLDALREADIPELAKAACWEADTNYPVPKYMSPKTCAGILRHVLPGQDKKGQEMNEVFAVVGASGNTGGATLAALLEQGAAVRAVVRDPAKGERWKARGAQVAVADLADVASLARAFDGAAGAFVLNPPAYAMPDMFAHAEMLAANIAEACARARLPRLVVLSSVGAHLASGHGNIRTNSIFERVLGKPRLPRRLPAARLFHGELGVGGGGCRARRRAAQLSRAGEPQDRDGFRHRHRRHGGPGIARRNA